MEKQNRQAAGGFCVYCGAPIDQPKEGYGTCQASCLRAIRAFLKPIANERVFSGPWYGRPASKRWIRPREQVLYDHIAKRPVTDPGDCILALGLKTAARALSNRVPPPVNESTFRRVVALGWRDDPNGLCLALIQAREMEQRAKVDPALVPQAEAARERAKSLWERRVLARALPSGPAE